MEGKEPFMFSFLKAGEQPNDENKQVSFIILLLTHLSLWMVLESVPAANGLCDTAALPPGVAVVPATF